MDECYISGKLVYDHYTMQEMTIVITQGKNHFRENSPLLELSCNWYMHWA